ncbi:DUF2975 domain-containing protein [Planococcus antarcticus]|uniref:DUF2975 domain-containing protein n=1 Tax=Planococcus antarcticus TaxID=161360 RepID=UPI001389C487
MLALYDVTIARFVELFQTFKLLDYIGRNRIYSKMSVSSLKKLKYSTYTTVFFFAAGLTFLVSVIESDIAGKFMVCPICTIASGPFVLLSQSLRSLMSR